MKKLIPLTLLPLLTLLALDATGQQSNPLRINCPPNQTNWHCGVASTAIVTYPAPTTTGSCPTNAVVTCTPPSGALFILGTTTVTCRATNSCRESVTCTFTVTVARDTTPPVIQCPTNRIVWLCSATATTATVSWPPPPASDNGDANVVVTCSPASGTFFSLGTTTVTCTATDDCTNRTTCTFTVTVARDTTPPVIQCPSNIVLQTCSPTGAVVNFPAPGASDNYDPMPAVVCTPPSGSAFPLGTNAVTCTATDDCTNRSTCTFTITVVRDTTPPVITCPSNIVLNCLCPGQVIILDFFQATATDNHDPSPVVVCDPPSLVSSPGVHVITCTATDNCGNSSRCQFTVTFDFDTTPPVIHCPSNMVATTCSNYAVVKFDARATDACDPNVTVVCQPPSGSLFPLGVTTVTCMATDHCTNTSRCTFTVRVRSATTPVLEVEPNNTLAGAQDLGTPDFAVVVGRIGVAGDADYYRFTAPPNARAWITVDTGGQQWAGANSRDSVLTLLNAGGAVMETDDNDGSGNGANSILESGDASAIAGATLAPGAYFIRVTAAAPAQIIAPYRLYLTVTTNNATPEMEPNNHRLLTNLISHPAMPTGVRLATLTTNDEDWYAVIINGPSLLHISVDGDPERDGVGTDVVVDLFRRDGISILFTANSSAGGGSVAEGFPYRLTPIGSYATYYVRVRGAAPNVTGSYRIMVAACPGQPELPLAAASLRANGLRLSWPAAVEPSVVRFSRDLRTWSRLNLSPVLEGDQLRVELPSDAPHQFFQLVPAGGWSNDTLSCCNANGCVPYPPGGCPNDTIIWCRDEGEGTTCTALPPITEPEPD